MIKLVSKARSLRLFLSLQLKNVPLFNALSVISIIQVPFKEEEYFPKSIWFLTIIQNRPEFVKNGLNQRKGKCTATLTDDQQFPRRF